MDFGIATLYFCGKSGIARVEQANEEVVMNLIRKIVHQSLATGYLTVEAEEQLRQLLRTKYDFEDFTAFISLQKAAMEGRVKQESRELQRLKSSESLSAMV